MSGPENFEFTTENLARAKAIVAKYPEGRQASAVMPLLDLAQRQAGGWLPRAAMDYVGDYLGMPHIRVYEVASFYEMYNLAPVGEHFIRICITMPCMLRGSHETMHVCEDKLGIAEGETTADGKFTLHGVQCLGACVNAPVVWIGDDYYEDVGAEQMKKIIDALKKGEAVKPGSQIGRHGSMSAAGRTTLLGSEEKA